MKYAKVTVELHIILNFLLSSLYLAQYLPRKLTFYSRVLKLINMYVGIIRRAAGEIRMTIFSNPSEKRP
jgi:hypothetical protein